jgi:protein-S-isoprenylcysteine O-methyltransferase Ste14
MLRALVWLGVFAWWVFLKKPAGSSVLAVRPGLMGLLGLGLIAVGLGLHLWSMLTLAEGIDTSLAAPMQLLMHGPYRYVRNPLYLGAWFVFVGIYVLYAPWRLVDALVAAVLATITHLIVVLIEEPAARKRLGAQYDEYCRRVPRWIPRLPNPSRS